MQVRFGSGFLLGGIRPGREVVRGVEGALGSGEAVVGPGITTCNGPGCSGRRSLPPFVEGERRCAGARKPVVTVV